MKRANNLDFLTERERHVVQEFVDRVRQRFDGQLVAAVLFGSRARGEATPDSDMDVLVVMHHAPPEIRKAVRHLAAEVWLEHDIYLSTRVWSAAHWRELERMQTGFFRNVCRDGISLLDPSPATD
jgi:predicted nucleotidyltransferase